MCMAHWWNDADRRKPKYPDETLSQCYFVHHKSHMGWSESELRSPLWEADDHTRPEPRHVPDSVVPLSLSWWRWIQARLFHRIGLRFILNFSSHLRLGLSTHPFPSGLPARTPQNVSSVPCVPHALLISSSGLYTVNLIRYSSSRTLRSSWKQNLRRFSELSVSHNRDVKMIRIFFVCAVGVVVISRWHKQRKILSEFSEPENEFTQWYPGIHTEDSAI